MECGICGVELAPDVMCQHEEEHAQACEASFDPCDYTIPELADKIEGIAADLVDYKPKPMTDEESTDEESTDWRIDEAVDALGGDCGYYVLQDANVWAIYPIVDYVCAKCGRCFYAGEVKPATAKRNGWHCTCGADADALVS